VLSDPFSLSYDGFKISLSVYLIIQIPLPAGLPGELAPEDVAAPPPPPV
jgi:hypothetical protein